jgi:cobalt/nickel transport system permease protein
MNHPIQPLASSHHAGPRIDSIDPRVRLIAAVAVSIVVAVAQRTAVPATALGVVLVGLVVSGLPVRAALKRLLPLGAIMALMVLLLPLTTDGTPLFRLGPVAFSREGLQLGVLVALKGSAIALALLVLMGSIDPTALGHTLSHLRVPDKLTHLLLFTVRYLDVLHREYVRLRTAARVRGFRPRMDRHTYRTYGHLVGMLLVRSFDRADRIVAAMKCRGFHGRFFMFDHFAYSRRDVPFAVVSAAVLLALIWMEWA